MLRVVGERGGGPDARAPHPAARRGGSALARAAAHHSIRGAQDKQYDLDFKNQPNDGSQKKTAAQMLDIYREFCTKYPMISIEDPFEQDDWEPATVLTSENICQVRGGEGGGAGGWAPQGGSAAVLDAAPAMRRVVAQVVGDDMLVTNPERVKRAIQGKVVNALLLKVNQIGTVTESIEAVRMSKEAGWGVMTSHRSGETEDSFIADLAVGLSTGQIKTGAPCRSERNAKYNQLLRIEEVRHNGVVGCSTPRQEEQVIGLRTA